MFWASTLGRTVQLHCSTGGSFAAGFCGDFEGFAVRSTRLPKHRVLGFCLGTMSTVKVCVVFLDTLTPEFELYVRLRERRQGAATRGSRPESLKVSGLGLQQCGLQVWCWFVSTVLDPVEVERQLDLSSVAARLRGRLVLFVRVCGWCRESVLVTRVRLRPVSGRRSRVRHVIGLSGLNGEDCHKCLLCPKKKKMIHSLDCPKGASVG
ncbi:hypothetical protein Taro_050723 [Colocasia esculenta]|uniref:Uncharacterized protein n=1 Tax=Colocasia esculenta TaxID=4460 RepID=A0A843XE54_COLES|nr:hypothetical protein [Colocasia esculenta]